MGTEFTKHVFLRPHTFKRLQAEKVITGAKTIDDAIQDAFRELDKKRTKKRDVYGMMSVT